MTPAKFETNSPRMWHIGSPGGLNYNNGLVSTTRQTRPVINIKAEVELEGSGTATDPYRIVGLKDYTCKGSACETILADKTIITRDDFSTTFEDDITGTIYKTSDWDGVTYYFAGNSTDNWVQFGGYYWRIIRINGDGTTRLIYAGLSTTESGTDDQINTSVFNNNYDQSYYVGLSYDGTQHGIGTPSTILTTLNNWYNGSDSGNLATNYGSYIDSNAGFCSDRNTASSGPAWASSGSTFYYASYERLVSSKSPSLDCSSNDILNIPVGLITADEVAYAGGVYNQTNESYYLYTGNDYWTMSPYYFYAVVSGGANVLRVSSTGTLDNRWVSQIWGIRPVINLKADTLFTGTGTSSDPYKIA